MAHWQSRRPSQKSATELAAIRAWLGNVHRRWSDRVSQPQASSNRLVRFLRLLGPGLITGASDDDPSGIGTYAQAGAQLGFGIGWTMLLTFPLMAAIQEICARIGRTTGHGIAGNLCRHYPVGLPYAIITLVF